MIPRPIGFVSPRITRLEEEYASKGQTAVTEFWEEIAQTGAPLIESSEKSGHSLATFLWRADEPVSNVVIISELLHGWWWNGYSDSRLIRCADSNVYYRTFQVPDDICCLYKLAPNVPLTHPSEIDDMYKLVATAISDPLNRNTETDWTQRSVLRLSDAPSDEWSQPRPEVQSGAVVDCPRQFAGLAATQKVKIYLPNEKYAGSGLKRLFVHFDVETSIDHIKIPVIADNLIASGRIPPTAIVFVDPSDNRERDLNCSAEAAEAVASEIVPWARMTYGLPESAKTSVIGGGSMGGLMAMYVGLSYPETFGSVLAQAGAFLYGPERGFLTDWDEALADSSGSEWLVDQFVRSETKQLRIAIDVGTLEQKRDGFMHGLVTNRHMRNVLNAKGYELRYREFCGGHQYINWRSVLPESLEWVLSGAN